jgi:hypothetical protein
VDRWRKHVDWRLAPLDEPRCFRAMDQAWADGSAGAIRGIRTHARQKVAES